VCFAQPHRYRFHNLLVDLIDVQVAFDRNHAVRLARRDLAILFPDAPMEVILLLLEPAFVFFTAP
jgi:hypothetical protein